MIHIRVEPRLDADFAIVGAGPAGAAAACHFGRRGYKVLLIDQNRFPRDKVCGDFVGPNAMAELESLGLLSSPPLQSANQIRRAALYLDGAKLVGQPFPEFPALAGYGLCVPRAIFDNLIVSAARDCGAQLIEGAHVTGYKVEPGCVVVSVRHGSSTTGYSARLLIGADGSSSLISRLLRGAPPPKRDRIVAVRAYFEGVEGPSDQADLYFSSSTFPGYCWLFPTGPGTANVGVGTLVETWPPSTPQLRQLLTDVLDSDPAIRFRLSTARLQGKIVGWPLATFDPNLAVIGDRIALIGDAAGFINPLNGEGIQYALQSARWLAECVGKSLPSSDLASSLGAYAARVQHELRYDMAVARMIIDLISNRTLNPLWLQALRSIARRAAFDREYARRAGGILAGIAPTREALTLVMLWGTVQQLVLSAGTSVLVDALCGPRRLGKRGAEIAQSGATMTMETISRPTSVVGWGLNCAMSMFELAAQFASAALAGPAPSHNR